MTVDLAPSHRERKKLATRHAIHDAAFELVEEHGLSGVTIEAISERAGVAPRTFWAYFASKEDAVLDRDPARPEALRLALLLRPAGEDALTALRRVLEQDFAERFTGLEQAIRRTRLVRAEPPLRGAVAATFDEIERALALAVAERLGQDPETDILPGLLVSCACSAFRLAQFRVTSGVGGPSVEDSVDEAFTYLAKGFSRSSLERTRR